MTSPIRVPVVGDQPRFAHPDDAGADLTAAERTILPPGARAVVPTGVRIALPSGTVGLVVPRSGLAAKHGITLVNSPGTIDAGYRGELKVIVLNTDAAQTYTIEAGDRIAQLIVIPIPPVEFVPVGELSESERGEAGFGSTGYTTTKEASDGAA
ncbi:dUTP diphosphatase [Pseudoclavibacter endophyticus]|uniref:dUTP diphosphatase n=1 Tax=Pseudoclavibacter endophyticus TaxID=1778590 RepID=UPI0016687544|nr:dUTP diphosphatase [Pseudoclavibacter endophyticus]